MGFRFYKSIRLGKGVRLNLSKSGLSVSARGLGGSINVGSRGVSSSVGIPGTGLSYRARMGTSRAASYPASSGWSGDPAVSGLIGSLGAILALVGVVLLLTGVTGPGVSLGIVGVMLLVLARLTAQAAAEVERQAVGASHTSTSASSSTHRQGPVCSADLVNGSADTVASRIARRELWLGQTEEQVRASLGEPVDIDEKVMKTRKRQVWKYDQKGANRFATRITLENGIVTGWDRK